MLFYCTKTTTESEMPTKTKKRKYETADNRAFGLNYYRMCLVLYRLLPNVNRWKLYLSICNNMRSVPLRSLYSLRWLALIFPLIFSLLRLENYHKLKILLYKSIKFYGRILLNCRLNLCCSNKNNWSWVISTMNTVISCTITQTIEPK